MPNDLLIKLNQHDFKVCDVNIKPVYHVGEKSGIRLSKVIPRISWLLFKGFWKRLFFKYVIRDFHPLVFFYCLSFFLLIVSIPLAIRLFYIWFSIGDIPDMNALGAFFHTDQRASNWHFSACGLTWRTTKKIKDD